MRRKKRRGYKRGRKFSGKRNRKEFNKGRRMKKLNYPKLSRGGFRL